MKIVVLTGGVGGAKFVLGLQNCEEVSKLTAIVNTGDDFQHLGLHISPDIDTLLYTLSNKSNKELGWGRENETWNFMSALKSINGPDWFNLGDGDLALHIYRTQALSQGATLSEITNEYAQSWNIKTQVLPMTNDEVATWLETDEGTLSFQHYFVMKQCKPKVKAISFKGAETAKAAPLVLNAIKEADAIFIAPSNPYLSIDPILAIGEIAEALKNIDIPIIVISPIVGGGSVKGPTSKLMGELGLNINNQVISEHYAPIIDGLLHDVSDDPPKSINAKATSTLMTNLEDKINVAKAAIEFARMISK